MMQVLIEIDVRTVNGVFRTSRYVEVPNEQQKQMVPDGILDIPLRDLVMPRIKKSDPMTNGDRIRQMTDEELAKLFTHTDLCEICGGTEPEKCADPDSCWRGMEAYLKKEEFWG